MATFKLHRTPEQIAADWHALMSRRRDHMVDLYRSGRWKRYYSERNFISGMEETVRSLEAWEAVVQRPPAKSAKNGSARA